MNVMLRPLRTSVGAKYVMAVTGLGLMGFVLAHMLGNLQIFLGKQALNDYAHHLEESPALVWTVRIGLLTISVIHIILGIRLWLWNRGARPTRYYYEDTVQATWASRHMLLTGLVILAFVIYHLLHFTLGVTDPQNFKKNTDQVKLYSPEPKDPAAHGEYDAAAMVVGGFDRDHWTVSLGYVLAQLVLGLHLWHGAGSWLQSLGWSGRRWLPVVRGFGIAFALLIVVGNCSIPLAVLLGWRPQ
jgi:succinate dehydrogenase / fumarate reductase, cytochrome b subunit